MRPFVRVLRQLILGYGSKQLTEYMVPLHDELMEVATNNTYSLAPLCAMIELGELTLMPALTQRPAQMLEIAIERGVVFSSGWSFLIPRVLGVAAMMQEDWRQAEIHFQHAIAVAAYVNAVPELARTYLNYARLICLNPNTEDATPAAEFLEQARAMFHERNMLPHAQLAHEYAENLFGWQLSPEERDMHRNGEEPLPPSTNGTTAME